MKCEYDIVIENKIYKIIHSYIKDEDKYIIICCSDSGDLFNDIEESKVFNYDFYEKEYEKHFHNIPKQLIEEIYHKKDEILCKRARKKQEYLERIDKYIINIYKQPLADKAIRIIYGLRGKKRVLELIEEHRLLCITKGESGKHDYSKIFKELNIKVEGDELCMVQK